jgi:hypothetical protein
MVLSALRLLLLTLAGCATLASTGSIYRGRDSRGCDVHVGVRPASDALNEWAVTVQVSRDWSGRCPSAPDARQKP